MKKLKQENGFDRLVFEKGDGTLRRWSDSLQPWRLVSPERRKLRHARSWYLDGTGPAQRPVLGLRSLALFAENLLWHAYRDCPRSRAFIKALRLFQIVRKKMNQMRYRGDRSGRLQTHREKMYMKATINTVVEAARDAYAAVEEEAKRRSRMKSLEQTLQ